MKQRAGNGNTQVKNPKIRTTSDKTNQCAIYSKLSFLLQTRIRPKYVFFTLLDFFLTENVLFPLVLWFSEDDAVPITEQLVRTCSGRICEVLLSPLRTQRDITGPNSESCCG